MSPSSRTKPRRGRAVRHIGKNPAAVELGSLGGLARAAVLTKARMKEIARMGGAARWAKRAKPAA